MGTAKGAQPPIFGPCPLRCGQTAGWIKMSLGTQIGFGQGNFALDGDPAPPPQKKEAQSPAQFLAHVYCGQTAGCISIRLGREVGLGPGDIVLLSPQH